MFLPESDTVDTWKSGCRHFSSPVPSRGSHASYAVFLVTLSSVVFVSTAVLVIRVTDGMDGSGLPPDVLPFVHRPASAAQTIHCTVAIPLTVITVAAQRLLFLRAALCQYSFTRRPCVILRSAGNSASYTLLEQLSVLLSLNRIFAIRFTACFSWFRKAALRHRKSGRITCRLLGSLFIYTTRKSKSQT